MSEVYYTTEKSGFYVAGRRIPSDIVDGAERPRVGYPLTLTPAEAEHDLLEGAITRVKPAADIVNGVGQPATGGASKPVKAPVKAG